MPDLESMIAEWRRAMKRGGIRSRDELDELEGHLRDSIDERLRSGVEPDRAFSMAADRMGAPRQLRNEFQKIQLHRIMNPKMKSRLTEVLVVIALIAVQIALLLPIAHKWKAGEAFAAWDFAVLAGWTLFVLAGAIVFAKARRLKA
jgi:hypothetical protein